MATKKATELKPVTLTKQDGTTLTLTFNRDMVLRMEDEGYASDVLADLMETKPNKGSVILTYYALLLHQPDATIDMAKELYFAMGAGSDFIRRLSELYGNAVETLIDGDGKNSIWTMD